MVQFLEENVVYLLLVSILLIAIGLAVFAGRLWREKVGREIRQKELAYNHRKRQEQITTYAFVLQGDKKVRIRARLSDLPTKMMYAAHACADLDNRMWVKNRHPDFPNGSIMTNGQYQEMVGFPKGDMQELWDTYAGKRFMITDHGDGTFDREFVDRELRHALDGAKGGLK